MRHQAEASGPAHSAGRSQPLDTDAGIRRVDRSGMLGLIAQLPSQFEQGFATGWRLTGGRWPEGRGAASSCGGQWPRPIAQVAFVGMGGSAISGDLVKALLTDTAVVPLAVHRTYDVPRYVGRNTLVIASSYSGDTEETLSAYRQARQRGAMLAAVTSGGQLGRWAMRDGIPWGRVPTGLPPRAALGYLAGTPLGLLARSDVARVTERELRVATAAVRHSQRGWAPGVPTGRNLAKRLAKQLHGRMVVLYGADGGWEAVVARWRGQLAENAKALASSHLFPEMTHNEVNGWEFPPKLLQQCAVVFLQDRDLHPRVLRRMTITARIIRRSGATILPVSVAGPTRLARMLNMIALGDAASVYLAVLHRVDPTPVERVTYLKHNLGATRHP